MDAEQFKLSKQVIKKLGTPAYNHSYVVIGSNITVQVLVAILLSSAYDSSSIGLQIVLVVLSVFLWALQMTQAFVILHECCHGSFFKQAKLNEVWGRVFGFLALMPFYARRREHIIHHQVAGSFEETTTKRAMQRFLTIKPFALKMLSWCWKYWIPIFTFNEYFMHWKLAIESKISSKAKQEVLVSGVIYTALVVLLTIEFSAADVLLGIAMVFMPAVYLYIMLIEFFSIAHHVDSPIEDIQGTIPYYEQMKFTKSCAPLPYALNYWYLMNFNYHEAHHLYPALHWTQLEKAHHIMRTFDPALGTLQSEYEINASLRRKPIRQALWKYFDFLPIFSERLQSGR